MTNNDLTIDAELLDAVEHVRTTSAALPLANDAEYEALAVFLRDVAAPAQKRIEEWFAPLKKAAFDAHRAITQREKELLERLGVAEARRRLSAYLTAREQRRAEEARAARAAAEEAERQRRMADAERLLEAGDDEAAERVLAAPLDQSAVAAAVPVDTGAPKVAGVSSTETWDAVVYDAVAFVRWLASGTDDDVAGRLHYVKFDTVALRRTAQAQRQLMNIPGVRPTKTTRPSIRGKGADTDGR